MVTYCWCRSRRKTLGITIQPDKTVAVRVPTRTSAAAIREFVTNRAEWILKVWKIFDAAPVFQNQGYYRGAKFMYQGKAYQLEFTKGPHVSLHLHEDLFVFTCPDIPLENVIRKTITTWYRKQALEVVKARSIECHRMMNGENIPLPPTSIRSMKTRWGSYSYHTKKIALNLNLVRAPQACLDYVIVHELCHIKIRHHKTDFWNMVRRYVPNYQELKKQLKLYIA